MALPTSGYDPVSTSELAASTTSLGTQATSCRFAVVLVGTGATASIVLISIVYWLQPAAVLRELELNGLTAAVRLAMRPPQPSSTRYATPPSAAAKARPGECRWENSTLAHFCTASSEAGARPYDREADLVRNCPRRAHAYRCTHGTTRALLVGPFASRPGRTRLQARPRTKSRVQRAIVYKTAQRLWYGQSTAQAR